MSEITTDHLDLRSPDLVSVNIEKIAALFPNCVTETEEGKKIDFDLLRQELSRDIIEGPKERYRLEWPGKKEAIVTANIPTTNTLRPVREDSVDFDNTENLYIEGDNLEVLKILQESYLGKIKMIYIDPPYNTGKDFVYRDNYTHSSEQELIDSGQKDEIGRRLAANPESSGRYHSDWLSMLYPRLKLARNLLSDQGVMVISIDDNEVHNLRKICDEIFGESQFAAQIIWKKRNTPPNDRVVGAQHEYLLAYIKKDLSSVNLRPRTPEQIQRYKNPDNHPKGPWVAGDLTANVKGGRYTPSLYYPIVNPNNGMVFYPPNNGNWRFNKDKVEELIKNDELYFGKNGDSFPKLKRFLCDVKEGITWTTLWDFAPMNTSGSNEMSEIFGNPTIFENPKPVELLKLLLDFGSRKDSIVLDFFAGSGSLAQAVLHKNTEDRGRRRYVLIQLPEPTNQDSEAYRAGFKNICEIGKERIRRAAKKIKEETNADIDYGFRVYRVDSSNMKDVYYHPQDYQQDQLDLFADNIKEDRTAEDLVTQIMLDWGLELSLPIERKTIASKEVWAVAGNSLYCCFDEEIDDAFATAVAQDHPLRIVFRDSAFKDDTAKENVKQLLHQLSPETEMRVI